MFQITINQARALCKEWNIEATKTWKKSDYVNALYQLGGLSEIERCLVKIDNVAVLKKQLVAGGMTKAEAKIATKLARCKQASGKV